MKCEDQVERLNALLDGELSAADAAAVSVHLAACPECSRYLAELAALRLTLQQAIPIEEVSPEFHAQVAALLDQQSASPPSGKVVAFRKPALREGVAWLAAVTAIAAMLLVTLLPHHDETKDLMSVRDAALRGAVWQTAANIQAPALNGFYLTAARTDVVAGHPAQVFAYGGADKTITLCIWPANGEPAHQVRDAVFKGMAISYWNNGRDEYWAATTGPASTLDEFHQAFVSAY